MPDVSKIKFRRKRRKGSATSSRQQAAPKRAAAAAPRVAEAEEEEVVDDVAEEDEGGEDALGAGSGTPARRKSSSGSSPPEIRFLDEKELRIDPPQARMTVAARRRDFFRGPGCPREDFLTAGELRDPNFWLRSILAFVFHAARKRKIYCLGRGFTCAKRYLQQKGWINLGKGVNNSKVCIKRIDQKSVVLHNLAALKENAKAILRNGGEAIVDKRSTFLFLILDFVPNYVWITHRADIRWNCLKPDQVVNRFPSVPFTTKNGLNRILGEARLTRTCYPRCYEITDQATMERFIEDYKFTACCGLVRWFYDRCLQDRVIHGCPPADPEDAADAQAASVPFPLVLAFSLAYCSQKLNLPPAAISVSAVVPGVVVASCATEVKGEEAGDDGGVEGAAGGEAEKAAAPSPPPQINLCDQMPFDWQTFFRCYHAAVRTDFAEIPSESVSNRLRDRAAEVLAEVNDKFPQSSSIDGERNAWILKPSHASRGKGIIIRVRLEDILANKEHRKSLVVQKYIERPLLIYEVKFDIRQWFVVTSWTPLVVWMNRASYLRFCSQLYSLDSYHESVHLSNNAIQCKYNNAEGRSRHLPSENMWTSGQFRDFLTTQGAGDFWDIKIYPGMRDAIVESMQASQSRMNFKLRHRAFELFGADFMVSQDFTPWLIEINASPAIGPSTSVTARMVPQLLKDVLAVTTGGGYHGGGGGNSSKEAQQLQQWAPAVGTVVGGLECVCSGGAAAGEGAKGKAKEEQEKKKRMTPEQAKMIDYIDKVMSIPSCVSSASSKVTMLKKWINLVPKAAALSATKKQSAAKEEEVPKEQPLVHPPRLQIRNSMSSYPFKKPPGSSSTRTRSLAVLDGTRFRMGGGGGSVKSGFRRERQARRTFPIKSAGGNVSSSLSAGSGDAMEREFLRASLRSVQSAPTCLGGGGGTASFGFGDGGVRGILRKVPVCTDERMLAKYKCNHHL